MKYAKVGYCRFIWAIIILAFIVLFVVNKTSVKDTIYDAKGNPADLVEEEEDNKMRLTSPAFKHNRPIPAKYTCQGDDINPELQISEVPENTQSFVLIVDDPNAPAGTANPGWVHWVVFNIPPELRTIEEDSTPPTSTQGQNDFSRISWGGPCPPSGEHRYFFKLFALKSKLNLDESATKADVEQAMNSYVLDKAELIGLYQKS